VTVTVVWPVIVPSVAVMMLVPGSTAVRRPVPEIVAVAGV
jgi:hypothetical protein